MSDEQKPSPEVEQQKRRLDMTLTSFTMTAASRVRTSRPVLKLTFGCSNGFPNVNVEADEEGEPTRENGFLRLSSRLNGVNFYNYLRLLEMALKKEPGWKNSVECYHTYKDGKHYEEKQKINDLTVGVDNQGLVYTSILQPGRTSSKFVFGPTEWHNYRQEDGSPWAQKELNHLCVQSTVDGLRAAMGTIIGLDAVDYLNTKAGLPTPSIKPENGGGGGFNKGYQNNGGGNNGGFQKKPWNGNGGGGQGGGYQKKPWQGGNNNGGGGGGYQKKPWQGGGQNGGGNGGGGYQNRQGGGGGGYQNNNGGGFNKGYDKNAGGGDNAAQQKPPAKQGGDADFDDFDI